MTTITTETLTAANVAGRAAHAENRLDAPGLDATIREMTADLPIGGGAADLYRAFSAGYEAMREQAAQEVLSA